jgi:hypothetical protein
MSQLEVDKVIPQSGTTLTLGESGDTVSVPSGATLDASNATLTLPDDSVTTAKIDDGAVTNAKVDASAAIAYSKLNLATSIVNADISTTAAIATTKLGAGAVLQVVTATDSTIRSTTSGTYVTASNTLSVAITPSSASNKILLLFSSNGRSTTDTKEARYTFFRDATDLSGGNGFAFINKDDATNIGAVTLDSPNTTSSITYEIRMKGESGFTIILNEGNTKGNIIAIEIAG